MYSLSCSVEVKAGEYRLKQHSSVFSRLRGCINKTKMSPSFSVCIALAIVCVKKEAAAVRACQSLPTPFPPSVCLLPALFLSASYPAACVSRAATCRWLT